VKKKKNSLIHFEAIVKYYKNNILNLAHNIYSGTFMMVINTKYSIVVHTNKLLKLTIKLMLEVNAFSTPLCKVRSIFKF